MKNKWIFLILFIVAGYFLQGETNFKSFTGALTQEIPKEYVEEPQVYFCPKDNCEDTFAQFLNNAETSIHCALFDLDLPKVIKVLENKEIDIKIVTDNNNYKNIDYLNFVKQDNNNQLTHNKFCIIDNLYISTGSFNPTKNGAYKNNNNLILLKSGALAKNYEFEFQELWNGKYGRGEKVKIPVMKINDKIYENYFCPEDNCEQHVLETLKKAKNSIYFMTFSFTSDPIGDFLIKQKDNLNIKGIFEKSQNSKYSEYKKMNGMNIKLDSNSAMMHHKVFIIDESIIITGSYNPSQNGNKRNDENILIIHNADIARLYVEEFNNLF